MNKLLIRLIVLVVALVGVVLLARAVTPERVEKFLAAFGVEPSSVLNLCDNRVDSILFPDGRKIEEVKSGMDMKWVAYGPTPRELSYIEMEKWLGQYCRVATQTIEKLEMKPEKVAMPVVLVLKFIDGRTKSIEGFPERNFFAAHPGVPPFASSDLVEALKELRRLAQFEEKP